MFTGIVEEMGVVKNIRRGMESAVLTIEGKVVPGDLNLGDSVAVNGVCLTVVDYKDRFFEVAVMAETLRLTTLKELKPGDRVNLERALKAGGRFGGHIVTGHIDGVGVIVGQEKEDIAVVTDIQAPPEVMKYVVKKGSIAVDGISLTVVDFSQDTFQVSLIPHTAAVTTLGYKKPGDKVNLEADIIGKYVEKLLSFKENGSKSSRGLDLEFLAEHGFL
ncbi:MAG: riboflavin synthase [Clostridia bacterium]|nr:riboflavin synthase [Clostridia bacterium]